ncbi:hypothetical protein EOA27_21940 [Mesorhizobium sp. M2A.F.Ca.ET.037.01.1.1]|uniref:hypothetical protein n=1 Tax=unclassified Mesorhizobium TaxID=325217 RepID=UPI000F7510F6|nr:MULTISPECIES: hypothetical protein [unclassified Mesorhizobium]RUY08823.1 hypothetical protein EOA25_13020 [Mesorhizobium sp. M2A.F.Ca.ET.040.01.1.1]RVC66427.1 hypothetical protein EN759_18925 [Mesorhizobium sp. M00.F.Ca.ET.038.03.1.1]RVC75894.1 hypothetical protein EN766_15055 [Mesorhizobium sp. M2A.F.Ca.ET.046.02.1.1]AZO35530.1 hypothetical protein EJ072_14435 [Mesorhizobium sp. M2A.F.Ca.ET.046.03.2.1]RUX11187.1 hypothetical protein EOA27_21940 [Mesorhizobium sp. M2A.F.Ca.ET.037.01.1.1]
MIVRDHFATLKDEGTDKVSVADYLVMLGAPIALALLAWALGFSIPDAYVGTLVSVFAIFAGLLFNVLVLIYSFADSSRGANKELRDRLLRQSFSNISFTIVSSLVIVFLLTSLLFTCGITQRILETLATAIAINFFLSLLMVLKRIHVLLRDKFGG